MRLLHDVQQLGGDVHGGSAWARRQCARLGVMSS
jgi:hypothetical protein